MQPAKLTAQLVPCIDEQSCGCTKQLPPLQQDWYNISRLNDANAWCQFPGQQQIEAGSKYRLSQERPRNATDNSAAGTAAVPDFGGQMALQQD
jgi:hypothetical protein